MSFAWAGFGAGKVIYQDISILNLDCLITISQDGVGRLFILLGLMSNSYIKLRAIVTLAMLLLQVFLPFHKQIGPPLNEIRVQIL